jgi:ribosomal protein L7/L12
VTWYWLAGIAVVLLVGFLSRRGERSAQVPKRLRSEAIPATQDSIDDLLRAGQKIEAIKMYRRLHGVDLKSAKDAMDARAHELGR